LFRTWLTVAVDTFANRATSALVGRATSSALTRTPPLDLNVADDSIRSPGDYGTSRSQNVRLPG
jgi:hypothetical protein